mgnify:CR=1 FL=1
MCGSGSRKRASSHGPDSGRVLRKDASYGPIIPTSLRHEQDLSKTPTRADLSSDGLHRPDRQAVVDQPRCSAHVGAALPERGRSRPARGEPPSSLLPWLNLCQAGGVVRLRHQTGYGRARLSCELWRWEHIVLSPNTIRHILRRHGLVQSQHWRKLCYPTHWAWEIQQPFALALGGVSPWRSCRS